MAGFINSLEADILDHVFGKATYTAPSNWWIALSTTTPTETGTNFTEPAGGAYARIQTSPSDWDAAVDGDPTITDNANQEQFATATADWGTVTHFGLFTSSGAGTVQIWGALSTSKRIGTDDRASFAAGALDIKLGDPGDSF